MRLIPQVIFDTSTLVGAALRTGSVPYLALARAFSSCVFCVSIESLEELAEVLKQDKFNIYRSLSLRLEFLDVLRGNAQIFSVRKEHLEATQNACRDPQDNLFLALALAAEADQLISSDQDLLVLHPWKGVSILTPAEFLR
jgi:hypothetical protein